MTATTDALAGLDAVNEAIELGDEKGFLPHPAATAEQNDLLEWASKNTISRPGPSVVNGRYRAAPPEGGRARSFTRVTNFAATLDDRVGLEKWSTRNLLKGLVSDETLMDRVRSAPDDSTLNDLANLARLRGGDKLAADIGTALHTACEVMDADDLDPAFDTFPTAYKRDVLIYERTMETHRLTVDLMEPIAFTPIPGADPLVGRIDRIVTAEQDRTSRILDLKFGGHADRVNYAVQLAIYSRATHLWGPDGWLEAPEIDQSIGYIMHIPAGTGAAELVEVDLDVAWDLVLLAARVRESRRTATKKGLFDKAEAPAVAVPAATNGEQEEGTANAEPNATAFGAVPQAPASVTTSVPDSAPATRSLWIDQRITTLLPSKAAKEMLGKKWPSGIAKSPPWTDAEVDTIAPVLAAIESLVEAPFGHRDPKEIAAEEEARAKEAAAVTAPLPEAPKVAAGTFALDDGEEVSDAEASALRPFMDALPQDRLDLARSWQHQGRTSLRPWHRHTDAPRYARPFAITIAAVRCLTHLWDDDEPEELTRAALALTINEPFLPPSWPTGAVLGSLTIDQAQRLDDIATAFAGGDNTTTADLAAVITNTTAA
jgi:hypothetical protein